jgi:hypothetical protein
MAPETLLVHQLPPEFHGEALRRVETLRALVAEGERLARDEAQICGPKLRAAARWRWASLALLGLALAAFLQDFFIEANGLAFVFLVIGLGGHLIAEQRQDELMAARERLFDAEKQALSLQWSGLGITEPALDSLPAFVPEVRLAYGWSEPEAARGDMTVHAFIEHAEARVLEDLRSAA